MPVHIPHYLLLALAAFGYAALHHFSQTNGFFALLDAAVSTKVSGRQFSTNQSLDDTCNFFLAFFSPTLTGLHPGLSLAAFVFSAQWIAGLTLVMIEAYRPGNRGRLVSFVSVFGLFYQTLGLGLCAPLYLFLHLLTSPTAANPTVENTAVDSGDLIAVFAGLIGGYIAPTLFMSLAPTASYSAQSTGVLIWQLFPIYTSVLTFLLSRFGRRWYQNQSQSPAKSSTHTPPSSQRITRFLFAAVIAVAGVAHIAALTLSVTPLIAPSIFNQAHTKELTDAYLAFPPWPFNAATKVSSIPQGALWFLQYDYILTSWALLIWSLALRFAAAGTAGAGAPGAAAAATIRQISWVQLLLRCMQTLVRAAVLGPMGEAALLIWERDDDLVARKGAVDGVVKKTM